MIYLLVGIPGSGKSWVCEQLKNKFEYVRHDDYMKGGYVEAVLAAAEGDKPVLAETPFSISQIMEPAIDAGHEIELVFIVEKPSVVAERYLKREGKPIIQGHLTRQETYVERAKEYGAFMGTSDEVLERLKTIDF